MPYETALRTIVATVVATALLPAVPTLAASGSEGASDIRVFKCENGNCADLIDLSESHSGQRILIRTPKYDSIAYVTKPEGDSMDLVVLLHGTTNDDAASETAALKMPEMIRAMPRLSDACIVSLAYRETGMAIGDDVLEPLDVFSALEKNPSLQGLDRKKLQIIGHSRGGYVALMINAAVPNDGIVVNAPGPLDIAHSCEILLESGNPGAAQMRAFCAGTMAERYGTLAQNRGAYEALSVANRACFSKSPVLFLQGGRDKRIQIEELAELEALFESGRCPIDYEILRVENAGHSDIFEWEEVWSRILSFLDSTGRISENAASVPESEIRRGGSTVATFAVALAAAGIIERKTSFAEYRPNSNITRAEIAKIVVNLKGADVLPCSGKTFEDVTYELGDLCAYVETAASVGIVNRAKRYRPNDFVTRAEALKMLLSARGIPASNVSQGFEDLTADAGLNGYVNAAAARGIIGRGGHFYPNKSAIRGVVFVLSGRTFGIGAKPTE